MRQLNRRTVLGLGSAMLSGCVADSAYFGDTEPPRNQELMFAIASPLPSLDPGKAGADDGHIARALFEGLTNCDPRTAEPAAGLATHYLISADQLRITLFLRGHGSPRGMRLPGAPESPVDVPPAYWSDGRPITAHDVVYSWRRIADPATAAVYAFLVYCVGNAQAIANGKLAPEKLAVRAPDDFSVQVDLRAPTPYFLQLLSWLTLFPIPRQAVEAARRSGIESNWTAPELIVTSGPFLLKEARLRDRVVVRRNPRYYDAHMVALDGVTFLLTPEASVSANLYKSGRAHVMPGLALPPVLAPALSRKRDIFTAPAFGGIFPTFNTTRPPFNNVLFRYALNMALDKAAVARVFGFGRRGARSLVPPLKNYRPPASVPVEVGGHTFDVLQFDPPAAREMLAKAGFRGGRDRSGTPLLLSLLMPDFQDTRLRAAIMQNQWRENLGIQFDITVQEFKTALQNIYSMNYEGVTDNADWGYYLDPTWFLDQFTSASSGNVSGWSDRVYDAMLAKAGASLDPSTRLERLAECEAHLLRAMPCVPLYHDAWAYPQKPFLRGMMPNILDVHPLKYAWIDTNWKPEKN